MCYKMWEQRIAFHQGMYYYIEKNEVSILSHAAARNMEYEYQSYQASMDVNRGGFDPEQAYPSRGFVKDDQGDWKLKRYEVDSLAGDYPIASLWGSRMIPLNCTYGQINFLKRRAFMDCDELTEIEIGSHISRIEEEVFFGCKKLVTIKLSEELTAIGEDAFLNTAFYKDEQNWSNGCLYLNHWLIKVDLNYVGELVIEDGTIGIADYAAKGLKQLTKIVLPESVSYVGRFAFADCSNLAEITFPTMVKLYGTGVIEKCPKIAKIRLPEGMTQLDGWENNDLITEIAIPKSVTSIKRYCFRNCIRLERIELHDGLISMEEDTIINTAYANDEKNWENGVLYLGQWLIDTKDEFRGEYAVKEGTIGIADYAFGEGDYGRSIVSITTLHKLILPQSLRYIGIGAFSWCECLKEIQIPWKVTQINRETFCHCYELEQIEFPENIERIDIWQFSQCKKLKKIVIRNSKTIITWPAFCAKSNVCIYGNQNSTAQAYAKKYDLEFEMIKENIVPKTIDINALKGEFAVVDGITYRATSYWKDVAIFELSDIPKLHELRRIPNSEVTEKYNAFAVCEYHGVQYSVTKLEDGMCSFITWNNKDNVYCKPIPELNEIWMKKNYGEGRVETDILYRKEGLLKKPSANRYYVDEMHNGDWMLCYLSEYMSLKETIKTLREYYGNRILFQDASLVIDELIGKMQIDQQYFNVTEDTVYDLITISPDTSNGNVYIKEMCDLFNAKCQ